MRFPLSFDVRLKQGLESQEDAINLIQFSGGVLHSQSVLLSAIRRDTLSGLRELSMWGALSPNHISHIINPKLYMSAFES